MKPIIASQTVFLNADRTEAVVEGDKSARFLIVRKGQEITEQEMARYPGAKDLLVGEPAEKDEEPEPEKKGHKKGSHKRVQLED